MLSARRGPEESRGSRVAVIRNPILRGFNPDPSIVRVGDDYYIATSTFEWFPGVQIHHSCDLVNWRLLTRPLDRVSQLDMRGLPDSGGIWAPCLSWDEGTFYLAYTVVQELNSVTKDSPNHLVTAESIEGPWSEPVYVNSEGFDPSLFHDEDGRKWWLNMVWDHRPGRTFFYGIALQEYSVERRRLVGESRIIFKGTRLGSTEGPHLYKRRDFYYLLTAEGGTGYEHAVTLARSREIAGPYEVHPDNPILTAHGKRSLGLQKTGHADLVETQNGDWYMVHLCSRPLPGRRRCILGRETAMQRVEWRQDDWLYLSAGGNRPEEEVVAPGLEEHRWTAPSPRDDFDAAELGIDYQTPRMPLSRESLSLSERPGYLRLYGGQSMQSRFGQVMIARRLQAFEVTAKTLLEFEPESFQQMAGLVCYYSTRLYHYLYMSVEEGIGPCLYIQTADDGEVSYPLGDAPVSLEGASRVYLRAELKYRKLQFSYCLEDELWQPLGGVLDASILSDDYGSDWGFTGAFIGLACQDLTGRHQAADFDFFEYRELD